MGVIRMGTGTDPLTTTAQTLMSQPITVAVFDKNSIKE